MRVRVLPPEAADQDHDNEPGWWAEKEEDEAAAAVGALSVDLQVNAVEVVTPDISQMVPMRGGVRMNVIADRVGAWVTTAAAMNATTAVALPALHCGDLVEAPMRLRIPERYRDPGAWQYADYLLEQGVGTHASVRASKVSVLKQEDGRSAGTGNWRTGDGEDL